MCRQKKRVTGGEMLVGPSRMLFADEISTGLDRWVGHREARWWRHLPPLAQLAREGGRVGSRHGALRCGPFPLHLAQRLTILPTRVHPPRPAPPPCSATTHDIVSAMRTVSHNMRSTQVVALLQPAPETYDLFDDIVVGCCSITNTITITIQLKHLQLQLQLQLLLLWWRRCCSRR